MSLYEINKKLEIARQRGFNFNQIYKLIIKIYSHSRHVNLRYYLKFPIPIMHKQFLGILSQNPEYVKAFCKDLNNPFRFACPKWISEKSS